MDMSLRELDFVDEGFDVYLENFSNGECKFLKYLTNKNKRITINIVNIVL